MNFSSSGGSSCLLQHLFPAEEEGSQLSGFSHMYHHEPVGKSFPSEAEWGIHAHEEEEWAQEESI